MLLTFVKYEYEIGVYIPTITDIDFENKFITVPIKYWKQLHRLYATICFRSLGEKRDGSVLSLDGEEIGGWL